MDRNSGAEGFHTSCAVSPDCYFAPFAARRWLEPCPAAECAPGVSICRTASACRMTRTHPHRFQFPPSLALCEPGFPHGHRAASMRLSDLAICSRRAPALLWRQPQLWRAVSAALDLLPERMSRFCTTETACCARSARVSPTSAASRWHCGVSRPRCQ
jgi:hypothetical protein